MRFKFSYCAGLLTFILIIFPGSRVAAQQDIFYLHDDFIALRNNPAYTGNKNLNDLMLLTRQQWVGFDGAPAAYLLASHFGLRNQSASIGAEIHNYNIGPVIETGLYLYYSYKITINELSTITMGLKGGVDMYQINLADLLLIDQGDHLFELDAGNIILPNFGTGLHYEIKRWFFDIGVPRILRNELNSRETDPLNEQNRQDRMIIFGGGAKYKIGEDIYVYPSFSTWVITDSPLLLNFKTSLTYKEQVGAGMIYRPGSSLGGQVWYNINQDIKFGYSYEFPVTNLRGPQTGTHEVYFGYNFSFTRQKTLSPRRF